MLPACLNTYANIVNIVISKVLSKMKKIVPMAFTVVSKNPPMQFPMFYRLLLKRSDASA